MAVPIVIDCDPGSDDAIALLMALASDRLEVRAVTVVGGNCRASHGVRNALRLLELAGGAGIPVAMGASRPLRGRFTYAYDFHGPGGLPLRLPLPRGRPVSAPAVELLARLLLGDDPPLVVALGPLTNLARLMECHPEALPRARGLVVMGGAVDCPGNVTPHAEFNFYNDPEAARRVLASGLPLRLVDLYACRQALVIPDDLPALERGDARGRLTARILRGWFRLHPDRDAYDMCDPLAVACLLDPDVATWEQTALAVVAEGERRGMSLRGQGRPGVHLARRVARERFLSLLHRLFGVRA